MAVITQRICDRCGKPIKYDGWTARFKNIFKRDKTIRITKLLNGNSGGYNYTDDYCELCVDCTRKLEDFMNQKEE